MIKTEQENDPVSRLVDLNDGVREKLSELEEQYPNARQINYSGSALVNILRFEESDAHPNDGMLMFVYRYDGDTDTYSLECTMEVNYRTVRNAGDRYRFGADEIEDADPDGFMEKKIEQFEDVYRDPPELMA